METEKPKNKGGRPMGSTNRLVMEARRKAEETGELPHEILLRIARGEIMTRKVIDPNTEKEVTVVEEYGFSERLDAAKAAAPYYAPKISTVEVIKNVDDSELDSIIAELAAQTGLSTGPGGEEPEDEKGSGSASSTEAPRKRVRLND